MGDAIFQVASEQAYYIFLATAAYKHRSIPDPDNVREEREEYQ